MEAAGFSEMLIRIFQSTTTKTLAMLTDGFRLFFSQVAALN
jgi:hypothetical protein